MLAGCFGALLVVGSSPAVSSVAPAADTQPPSVPQGMHVVGKSRTMVVLQWRAATDDVGVVGYHLYKNNARVATIAALRYTFRDLRCGTRYTLALEALDAAGNSSYRPEAVASVATSACVKAVKLPAAAPRRAGAKPSSAPPPGSAQLWVDTNGGSCRRSAAPRAYVDGRACSSLQSAYKAARTGDTVGIRTRRLPRVRPCRPAPRA